MRNKYYRKLILFKTPKFAIKYQILSEVLQKNLVIHKEFVYHPTNHNSEN